MAIVENNIVKMEWEKSEWLQTKSGTFIFAAKTYSGINGDVSVLFHPDCAYVWGSDFDDLWSTDEVKSWYKGEKPTDFPFSYEAMIEVIPSGERECLMDVLESLGLVEFKEDIEKRLVDIKPYGEEEDVVL
jgi:hypothetical protein